MVQDQSREPCRCCGTRAGAAWLSVLLETNTSIQRIEYDDNFVSMLTLNWTFRTEVEEFVAMFIFDTTVACDQHLGPNRGLCSPVPSPLVGISQGITF
jgi:hypothetical protein